MNKTKHVINLCKRYGISYVNVNMFMPLSNQTELNPPEPSQFFKIREEFKKAAIKISEPCYLRECIAGVGVLSILPNEIWDCSRSRVRLSKDFVDAALSGRVKLIRKSCLRTKPKNLFEYLKDELPPIRSPETLFYVASFKEYSIDELEKLESELRRKIWQNTKIGNEAVFSETINCLFLYDVIGKVVAYTNDKFLPETVEFVSKFAKKNGIRHVHGQCDLKTCDYLRFIKNRKVVIGCWSACNSNKSNENVIEAFRGVDGRKLDKMLIYWYYRKFGELPKWWQFFMCDLACKDEMTEKKLKIMKELFSG